MTDWILFPVKDRAKYCDCGTLSVFELPEELRGKFNVFVKKVTDSSCELKINCVFEITSKVTLDRSFSSKACVSIGQLEATIYSSIIEKL
jgi:hypothetical protein